MESYTKFLWYSQVLSLTSCRLVHLTNVGFQRQSFQLKTKTLHSSHLQLIVSPYWAQEVEAGLSCGPWEARTAKTYEFGFCSAQESDLKRSHHSLNGLEKPYSLAKWRRIDRGRIALKGRSLINVNG